MSNDLTSPHPILYLGKDRVDGSYYFLGSKNGVGRFLKYTNYPFWCASSGVGNFLDLAADVPVELLAEIMLFVNGKVNYELLPPKQGRPETIVRTDTRTNEITKIRKVAKVHKNGDESSSVVESSSLVSDNRAGKSGSDSNVGVPGSLPRRLGRPPGSKNRVKSD